jgi:SAM-dependent methyltransferase
MHGAKYSDDEEVKRALETGVIRFIKVPAGLRLLDVGCGGGWFLRICKKLGADVHGVEPSPHGAEISRRQGLNVFHGTLDEYADRQDTATKFDVITANHVLEHVPDPVATLAIMKQLLAPGGYIWIAVPNAAYPIARALKGQWHSSELPYHLMHFCRQSMTEAGRRAGLRVRNQLTESATPHVAASIASFLRIRFYIPYRLTIRSRVIHAIAQRYATRADSRTMGEGLLTEFVDEGGVAL